jgi:hypothetical protein
LEDVFAKIFNDPAADPTFDTIADISNVARLDLDVGDIQSLVNALVNQNPRRRKGRTVIITGQDQGRYSLGVYFKVLTETQCSNPQRIFRTATEAQAWLSGEPITA